MLKVLYIASNIPLPKRKNNRIVLTIAEKLSASCDISFVLPAAVVFPPFSLMRKYRPLMNLKPWTDGRFTVTPVHYLRLPGKKLSYLLINTVRAERYVDEKALPDLCHAHFIMPDGYVAYRIKQKYGVPYAVSIRSGDIRHLKALGNKGMIHKKFVKVLENADKIIVHNRPQQEFIAQLGFDSVLIPHGIESGILNGGANKPGDPVTVSVAAVLFRRKNVDWVIRAVKKYNGRQDIRLMIAGDGACRDELLQLAGNASNIHFMGKISHEEVLNLLEKSHIFALPSVNETFGLVYLEAAAKRNAVICRRDEGVDGLFEDGKEMVFCESFDDFQHQLDQIIDDSGMRNAIAASAGRKVNDYTWDKISGKYIAEYRKII
ncbi:MAG: glycosyltransferase family 4 protein [Bacteroidales bacterium]|jgi:glycosyltransferase involved in cell wall biosynthesis|nr:glycosyltransferase family 4 protein [Bacteroidales bacterium]